MSLEQAIQNLTAEVIALRQTLQKNEAQVPVAPAVPAPAPAAPVAAPVVAPPVAAPVIPPAPIAAPVPAAPVPAAPAGVPTSIAELQRYVMETYKAIGPEKGASIQAIITACGVANINEINPAHFGYVFEQVERLKAA